MKIVSDLSWMGATGIGRMAKSIYDRAPPGVDIIPLRSGKKNAGILAPLSLAIELSSASSKGHAFWSPGFMPPAWSRLPSSITIHDLTHRHFYGEKHRRYYDLFLRPLIRKTDLVFTVSDYSRAEILNWSGLSEDRVIRIYNGLDAQYCLAGSVWVHRKPYVLYVGNRRSYKNLDRLIEAFSRSTLQGEGYVLAITGDSSFEVDALVEKFGIKDSIEYLGFVAESDLPSVYRGAALVAFPSLYEGFGLPVIEAMGCGVPVVTSNGSSLPEVAGGAAFLVDPLNIEEIAAALKRVALDTVLRGELIALGLQRASKFSWDSTAADYWNAFEQAC